MKRKEFLNVSAITLGFISAMPFTSRAGNTERSINPAPLVVKQNEGKKLNVLGDNMTLKLTGEDTDGRFTLIEQNNEPGVGIPIHVHENEDEVFRVLEGQLELISEGRRTVLNPGDVGFCPRGIPHTWKVIGTGPAKVDLSFFPAGMEKMFGELARLPQGPPDMATVNSICNRYGVRFI